jgi:hypothetical protein
MRYAAMSLQAPWQLVDGWVLLITASFLTAAPIAAAFISASCIVLSLSSSLLPVDCTWYLSEGRMKDEEYGSPSINFIVLGRVVNSVASINCIVLAYCSLYGIKVFSLVCVGRCCVHQHQLYHAS